jgi:hypothetical protein
LKSRIPSVLLVAAAAPSAAIADIATQTVPFDYDVASGIAFPLVERFDTLGGARQLQGVTFEFRHNFAVDVYVESTGPTPVGADDFALSVSSFGIFQLGEAHEDPPFLGPGGFFVKNASGDLGAYDNVPGNDGPDSYRRSFTDVFTAIQEYGPAEPDVLAAVTGSGTLTTVLGGFTELFFGWNNDPNWPVPPGGVPEYPTDAAIWVSTPTFRHFGEIVITYEYANVPAPAGAAAFAFLAAGSLSRRRR